MPKKSLPKPEIEARTFDIKQDLAGHEWRQQGYHLVCHSCELSHAVYIGKKKLLIGINEKGPVFEKR
jgi:hypothetical protein